ncbi:MAG: hypothetical protein QOF04_2648 [Solirubrobacteraceae bacterium]|nr:hypothetical protein [Solirubrobacteraceae bacterium]
MGRLDDSRPLDPRERELAEQGRALVAAAMAQTHAPPALRERIAAQRPAARARPTRRRRLALGGALAGLAAAATVAVLVSVVGPPAPSVAAASALAARGPSLPAPQRDAANPVTLRVGSEGVPFPEWDRAFRWRAAGARRDELAGRPATTVFYDRPGAGRLAYTIVGGDPIGVPDGARRVTVRGNAFWLARDGTRRVVTWERGGHTCVMTAPAAMPEQRLIDLAAWDAGGGVPF